MICVGGFSSLFAAIAYAIKLRISLLLERLLPFGYLRRKRISRRDSGSFNRQCKFGCAAGNCLNNASTIARRYHYSRDGERL